MMLDFTPFKAAVARQFDRMTKHTVLRTATSKDVLWATYLGSFPAGTDPIYKERTEHDCNCCKSFIRAVGNVVAIIDGKIETIWDINIDGPYQVVADALAAVVREDAIANLFMHTERVAGVDKNFQQLLEGGVTEWKHFFVNIPKPLVVEGVSLGSALSDPRATHDVMLRSLTEITTDAIEMMLELIAQNSLYRGEEQKFAVTAFQKLKQQFDKLTDDRSRDVFVWDRVKSTPPSVARIRNTAAGTLLVDLSEGKELEQAVKAWEMVMAPANYKRPTALVTKKMVEQAREKIEELGLMSALERRYATIDDITVVNVLFADRSSRAKMAGNVFDDIVAAMPEKVKSFDKIEEVTIEKFLADILPTAKSVEVLFENRHAPNLVSLVAPVDPTAGQLFKWGNGFSWDYNGGVADSDLRQAVQARGGRVDGAFRFSHSWNHEKRNASLMDLYVFMPGHNGVYGASGHRGTVGTGRYVGWHRRNDIASGGSQDVDYTNAAPVGYVPVENITFPDLARMPEGVYVCKVHNYAFRPPTEGGFRAEIEFGGEIFQYEVDRPLKNHEWVTVAEVTLKNGQFTIKHCLPESTSSSSSKIVWGLPTQTFHKVKIALLSPNHWDGVGIGNRHYFFMLDGCQNEGTARGFYNEFLKSELEPHRKAFEMVGSKMRADADTNQLSGLGFSSTQRNHVVVRVQGAFSRVLKIVF